MDRVDCVACVACGQAHKSARSFNPTGSAAGSEAGSLAWTE